MAQRGSVFRGNIQNSIKNYFFVETYLKWFLRSHYHCVTFPLRRPKEDKKIGLQCIIQSNLHVRPPLVSDHLPYATANPTHQNILNQSLTVGTSSRRPPPASDCDHRFLGLTVNDIPLFLTSCRRPLNLTHSLISKFAVCTMLLIIYEEL